MKIKITFKLSIKKLGKTVVVRNRDNGQELLIVRGEYKMFEVLGYDDTVFYNKLRNAIIDNLVQLM